MKTVRSELASVNCKRIEIGVQLGISRNTLKKLDSETDPLSAIIDYWLKGNAKDSVPRTWQSIVAVLESSHVDEYGLAKKIREKYCCCEESKCHNFALLAIASYS